MFLKVPMIWNSELPFQRLLSSIKYMWNLYKIQCSTPRKNFINVTCYKAVEEVLIRDFNSYSKFIKHEGNFSKYANNSDNGKFIPLIVEILGRMTFKKSFSFMKNLTTYVVFSCLFIYWTRDLLLKMCLLLSFGLDWLSCFRPRDRVPEWVLGT